MEGAVIAFSLLVILSIIFPIAYHLYAEHLKARNHRKNLKRRYIREGLLDKDWLLVERALDDVCPENPDRLLGNPSLFNVWLDGLDELSDPSAELLESIGRIHETLYHSHSGNLAPASTRDLLPGASINIVVHRGGRQDVIPGIVTTIGVQHIHIGNRGSQMPLMPAGREVGLYYPRPEAMYHAACEVERSHPGELILKHAKQGAFKVRQLREFWRVDVDIPVDFRVYSIPGEVDSSQLNSRSGRIVNLSGSGAAIATGNPPPRGARIGFLLQAQNRQIMLQAELLHLSKMRDMSRMHLVFRNLDPGDQEQIVRSLFTRYRDLTARTQSDEMA